MTSESHQRQLLLFADNADRYINNFSEEFERDYLEVLKHEFGTKRVHANRVYQHYISDRHPFFFLPSNLQQFYVALLVAQTP